MPLDRVSAALLVCTHYSGGLPYEPTARTSLEGIRDDREQGVIDDPANLAGHRVWLFRGKDDRIIPPATLEALRGVYEALGVAEPRLRVELDEGVTAASHGLPVRRFRGVSRFAPGPGQAPRRCGEHGLPFVIECGYEAAELLLRHLLPDGFRGEPQDPHERGRLVAFDQTEFFDPAEASTSLSRVGYLYLPARCEEGGGAAQGGCRLHVAFHGCRQGLDFVHDDFIRDAGYNGWAAANDIVVLYPQTAPWVWEPRNPLDLLNLLTNPNGCWDFWGFTGRPSYYGREGKQMRAVRAMIDRLLRQ